MPEPSSSQRSEPAHVFSGSQEGPAAAATRVVILVLIKLSQVQA